jgi:hypothetical protein
MSPADAATIREALTSDNIHEHLAGLRGAVRATLDRVASRYAERRSRYVQSLQSILRYLEAKPEWARLDPDDREEIAKRLTSSGVPEVPTKGREVTDLRRLLARESSLNTLRAELDTEIERRQPALPQPPEPKEPPIEEVVEFANLMRTEPLFRFRG